MVKRMRFTAKVAFNDTPSRATDPVAESLMQLLKTIQRTNPELLKEVMTQVNAQPA